MKKNISIGIYIFFILMFFYNETFPWSTETHIMISFKTNLYFTKLKDYSFVLKLNFDKGIMDQQLLDNDVSRSIMDWITFGSDIEDDSFDPLGLIGARSDNHFHNPLKTFSDAGLSDIKTGESLLLWAQDGNKQKIYVQSDNSWSKVREYFFNALTSTENTIRQSFFAKTFKGLGHQIHLIQDSTVPDHVRNDSHPLNKYAFTNKKYGSFRCIESWAESNLTLINDFTQVPLFPQVYFDHLGENNLVPIFHLVDYGVYNGTNPSNKMEQGLAEYTNANFVSEDTILTEGNNPDSLHYFPYPKYSSTNLNSLNMPYIITAAVGKQDYVTYLKKDKDGEIIEHFLKAGYMERALRPNADQPPTEVYLRTFFLDELCHKDYASMLVPRAVGYSAALIDYFFRGEIEVTLPGSIGIYSFCTDSAEGFKKMSLMVKNITPDNEEMKNGHVSLVLSYRLGNGYPFELNPPIPEEERYYKVYSCPDVTTIPRDNPFQLDVDMSGNPLPFNAVDVTLTVVFKGDLGAELTDAVAIGFKDISEPTPIDLFNDTDKICFHGNKLDWNDPTVINEIDKNHDNYIDCNWPSNHPNYEYNIGPQKLRLMGAIFNGQKIDHTISNWLINFNDVTVEFLPGKSYRFYILADEDKPFNISVIVHNKTMPDLPIEINPNQRDFYPPIDIDGVKPVAARIFTFNSTFKNKLVWNGYAYELQPTNTKMKPFRDINYFAGVAFGSGETNSNCDPPEGMFSFIKEDYVIESQ